MSFALQAAQSKQTAQSLRPNRNPKVTIRTDRIGQFTVRRRCKNGNDLDELYCPVHELPAPYLLTLRMSLTKQLRELNLAAHQQQLDGSLSQIELQQLAQLRIVMIDSPVIFRDLSVGEVAIFDYRSSPLAPPLTLGLGTVLQIQFGRTGHIPASS